MYYLKYRPQTIAELDLTSVRETLRRLLSQREFPHAFLFAGPKGTGKTSAARIVAKSINCLQKKKIEPCNQCANCRAITNGSCLDVLEIDAASQRGIDEIRNLKEMIALAPTQCRYKVYIIDEVHMLTREAFNALLKTLEEPPPHVVFIFCTTEAEKLPATVLSRLVRVDFKKGTSKEVRRCLAKIINGEGLKIEEKVVDRIVTLADGGFRDAQKILEQLVTRLGKEIHWAEAGKILGDWELLNPKQFLDFLFAGEKERLLQGLERLASGGVNFSEYVRALLEETKNRLLATVVAKKGDNGDLAKLVALGKRLNQVAVETKNALVPHLPLCLLVAEWGEQPRKKGEAKVAKQPQGQPKIENCQELQQRWGEVLAVVKPQNHSVAAFLRAARPKKIEDKVVELEVFYPFHKQQLEIERNRRIVEAGLSRVLKKQVVVRFCLSEKRKTGGEEKVEAKEDLYQLAKEIFGV